jgi:hypothetical protein
LKGACQVLVAFARKVNVRLPDDAAELWRSMSRRLCCFNRLANF